MSRPVAPRSLPVPRGQGPRSNSAPPKSALRFRAPASRRAPPSARRSRVGLRPPAAPAGLPPGSRRPPSGRLPLLRVPPPAAARTRRPNAPPPGASPAAVTLRAAACPLRSLALPPRSLRGLREPPTGSRSAKRRGGRELANHPSTSPFAHFPKKMLITSDASAHTVANRPKALREEKTRKEEPLWKTGSGDPHGMAHGPLPRRPLPQRPVQLLLGNLDRLVSRPLLGGPVDGDPARRIVLEEALGYALVPLFPGFRHKGSSLESYNERTGRRAALYHWRFSAPSHILSKETR